MSINWKELFPSRGSLVIFILYMSLFVAQGLLVKGSQNVNKSYTYNTVTVVLVTEALKLIVSSALYYKSNNDLCTNLLTGGKLLGLYLIPAFLYCLYNNLAFLNLSTFDPTTYFLLLQLRVVFTGILFQVIFSKKLTKLQWFSLILLTFGCMINSLTSNQEDDDPQIKSQSQYVKSIILILVQTLCSCLAGVYNEYLLKKKGPDTNIYMQNIFMYLDSLACNFILLLMQGNLFNALTVSSIKEIVRLDVILIIVNNCAIGIVTSFFLKYMNSILKTFASALEISFTAILSYLIFSIPLHLSTVLSIIIVSIAIYFYSQSPVVNNNQSGTILPVYSDLKNYEKESKNLLEDNNDEEYDLKMDELR